MTRFLVLEKIFRIFWRTAGIVYLLSYPKDGSVGSSGSGGETRPLFFFGTQSMSFQFSYLALIDPRLAFSLSSRRATRHHVRADA
jgi:hypothetical protein